MVEIHNKVVKLERRLESHTSDVQVNEDLVTFNFHMESLEELQAMEEKLSDIEYRRNMVSIIVPEPILILMIF